jgi:hypothetical protein
MSGYLLAILPQPAEENASSWLAPAEIRAL